MSHSEFEVGDELLDLLLERPGPAVGHMGEPMGGPVGGHCAAASAFFPGVLGGLLMQQQQSPGKASGETEPWGLEDVLALTEDAQDELLQSFVMDDAAALQMLRAPGTALHSPTSSTSSSTTSSFPSPFSSFSSPASLASPSASDSGVSEGGGPPSPLGGVSLRGGPLRDAARPWAPFRPQASSPGGSSAGSAARSLSGADDVSIDFDGWEETAVVAAPSVVRALPALTAALRSSRQLLHGLTGAVSANHDVQSMEVSLTEEERKLLVQEGMAMPPHLPLTKVEERVLKRVRRKIRNKQSAQESRRRKKEYVDGLESRVSACTVHNHELQRKMQQLEKQNMSLLTQLRHLQSLMKQGSVKAAQTGTCIMVFLLSFALIVYPSCGPASPASQAATAPDAYRPHGVLSRSLKDADAARILTPTDDPYGASPGPPVPPVPPATPSGPAQPAAADEGPGTAASGPANGPSPVRQGDGAQGEQEEETRRRHWALGGPGPRNRSAPGTADEHGERGRPYAGHKLGPKSRPLLEGRAQPPLHVTAGEM